MNFGSLQIVTAWRLTRSGVLCQAIVMDGPEGVRLVVIEDQQIVEWIRFDRIFELRRHVSAAFKVRTQAGWAPLRAAEGTVPPTAREGRASRPRRTAGLRHGLLTIAEQGSS
jgi:hypothetical protein